MAEERLELVPRDRDKNFYVMSLFVLLPAEADPVSEEGRGKKNLSRPPSSSSSKVVLTLLTEVVAIHVRLSAIYVWEAGFQLLPRHLGDNESWNGSGSRSRNGNECLSLQNGLKNPLQVILGVLENTSSSGKGVSEGFCL